MINRRKCCCCTNVSATPCVLCSLTPAEVEAVVSGVGTSCVVLAVNRSADAAGATLAGTFTAVHHALGVACQWVYTEDPGTSFNFRVYVDGSPTPTNNCSIVPSATHERWALEVTVRDPGGGSPLKVRAKLRVTGITPAGVRPVWFDGEVDLPSACGGTVVVHNGDGGMSPHGVGGTITLTFCPT